MHDGATQTNIGNSGAVLTLKNSPQHGRQLMNVQSKHPVQLISNFTTAGPLLAQQMLTTHGIMGRGVS